MRNFFNAIEDFPYGEECPQGASRTTHGNDAVQFLRGLKARPAGPAAGTVAAVEARHGAECRQGSARPMIG